MKRKVWKELGLVACVIVSASVGFGQENQGAMPTLRRESIDPKRLLVEARGQLQRNPHFAFWHAQASNAYLKLCDLESAEKHIRESISIEPAAAQFVTLANVHVRGGRVADAMKAIEKAAQLDPGNPTLRCERGFLLELEGRTDQAVKEYKGCIRAVGSKQDFYLDPAGAGWSLAGVSQRAEEGVARIQSGQAKTRAKAPMTCVPDPDQDRVRADLARSLKEFSRNPHARQWHSEAALAYYFMKDYSTAKQEILRAINNDPEFADSYFLAASIAERQNDSELQITSLRNFLTWDPQNPVALYRLGLALEASEEYPEARKSLQAALDSLRHLGAADFYTTSSGTPYPIEEVRRDASQSLERVSNKERGSGPR